MSKNRHNSDLKVLFPLMVAKDDRVYLVKQMVNTLLASSLADNTNGLLKLNEESQDKMRQAVKNSNRFNDEEKTALLNLVELAIENKQNLRSVSATWGPDATAMDAIHLFTSSLSSNPRKWKENATPIDLDF